MALLYQVMGTSVATTIRNPTTNRLRTLRFQLMAEELAKQIGERIRERRLEIGMEFQRQLADALKNPSVTNQVISSYETGRVRPEDDRLREIGTVLGVDLDYFYRTRPAEPVADVMGAFNDANQESQLDRMERKLDDLLSRLAPTVEEDEAGLVRDLDDQLDELPERKTASSSQPSKRAGRAR